MLHEVGLYFTEMEKSLENQFIFQVYYIYQEWIPNLVFFSHCPHRWNKKYKGWKSCSKTVQRGSARSLDNLGEGVVKISNMEWYIEMIYGTLWLSFIIRSIYNLLSMGANLFKWDEVVDPICPLCSSQQTLQHVPSACKVALL